MTDADDLIKETRHYLSHLRLPHQASAVVMNLFLLSDVYQLADDPRVMELREAFHNAYGGETEDELAEHQVRYAARLASAPGDLIYEEMHKLFSLMDEVYALRETGHPVDVALLQQMEADVRARFAAQPTVARLLAEDRAEDWNRSLWWYADNLRQRGQH